MTDSDILKNIREGNKEAFEQLFKQLYRPLSLYAAKYLCNIEEAEETVEDVFAEFWEKADTINLTGSLSAYLYRWTANNCLNKLKHEKIKRKYAEFAAKDLQDNIADDSGLYSEPDLNDKIVNAIESLPPRCADILKKSRFDNLKNAQIASLLGISEKTVENQIGIAIKKLKEILADFL